MSRGKSTIEHSTSGRGFRKFHQFYSAPVGPFAIAWERTEMLKYRLIDASFCIIYSEVLANRCIPPAKFWSPRIKSGEQAVCNFYSLTTGCFRQAFKHTSTVCEGFCGVICCSMVSNWPGEAQIQRTPCDTILILLEETCPIGPGPSIELNFVDLPIWANGNCYSEGFETLTSNNGRSGSGKSRYVTWNSFRCCSSLWIADSRPFAVAPDWATTLASASTPSPTFCRTSWSRTRLSNQWWI